MVFPAPALLSYCLSVYAGGRLQLSLPTPKVTEVPKPFDSRIFYIGILACVQLLKRPDIAQRDIAEYDCMTGIVVLVRLNLELGQKSGVFSTTNTLVA